MKEMRRYNDELVYNDQSVQKIFDVIYICQRNGLDGCRPLPTEATGCPWGIMQ